jgi:hypothetical protein
VLAELACPPGVTIDGFGLKARELDKAHVILVPFF